MTKYEISQIILSSVTLTAAIIVACIYGCQLTEMQKTSGAAIDATKLTKDSLDFARENARRDQRPWVSIPTAICSKPPRAGEPIEVNAQVSNTGRSPALVETAYRFFTGESEAANDVQWNTPDKPESVALIAPNSGYVVTAVSDLTLTREYINAVRAGAKSIFLKVSIHYKYPSGNSYWTNVCLKCSGPDLDIGHLHACGSGNEAR